MKYEVITDTEGYCLIVRHTGTLKDFVELDMTQYDMDKIHAYKLGYNRLIFDSKKWEEIEKQRQKKADEKEIADLEKKLNDTDYIIARWGEEIVSLTNPLTWVTDVIKINLNYANKYREALANRKKWRERIEELRGD